MSPVGRHKQNRKFGFYLPCSVIAGLGTIIATSVAALAETSVAAKHA